MYILMKFQDIRELSEFIIEITSIKYKNIEIFSSNPNNYYKIKSNKSISKVCFVLSLLTLFLSLYFQFWTNEVSYKINYGSDTFFSIIYSLPMSFELVILISAVASFIAFIFLVRKKGFPDSILKKINFTENINILFLALEIEDKDLKKIEVELKGRVI